jgi:thioredoxin 1
MSEFVKEVNDADFDALVLKADKPVLVDFWAEWCGPCLALAPTIDAVAKEYEGRALVVKLNVDNSPATAQRYGIRGIPTLVLFHRGDEAQRLVGFSSKGSIADMLNKVAQAATA